MVGEHGDGTVLLRHHIEVIAAERWTPPAVVQRSSWPCPLCGERRPVADSVAMLVRNRTGPTHQRRVIVCSPCAGDLGRD